MKLFNRGLLASFLLTASATARIADIYLSPHDRTDNDLQATREPVAVSPSIARLVLAERFGVSDFHDLGNADEDTVRVLNDFASHRPVFRQGRNQPSLLIFVDGGDETHNILPDRLARPHFRINEPPSPKDNSKLLLDFMSQSTALRRTRTMPVTESAEDGLIKELSAALRVAESEGDVRIKAATNCGDMHPSDKQLISDLITGSAADIRDRMDNLLRLGAEQGWEITVVRIPAPVGGSSFFQKRSPPSSWGPYALPARSAEDYGSGRGDITPGDFDHIETNVEDRPDGQEYPGLLTKGSDTAPRPTSSSGSISSDFEETLEEIEEEIEEELGELLETVKTQQNTSQTPPKGILPRCYRDMESCVETTHDCSGHGSCVLAYKDNTLKNMEPDSICYSCQCKATVTKNKDGGQKTTYWSGPACQKQDISVAFWLLAGFTVLITAAVAWSIGLLYNMGAEELPSVIGAGVTGPRAK